MNIQLAYGKTGLGLDLPDDLIAQRFIFVPMGLDAKFITGGATAGLRQLKG